LPTPIGATIRNLKVTGTITVKSEGGTTVQVGGFAASKQALADGVVGAMSRPDGAGGDKGADGQDGEDCIRSQCMPAWAGIFLPPGRWTGTGTRCCGGSKEKNRVHIEKRPPRDNRKSETGGFFMDGPVVSITGNKYLGNRSKANFTTYDE
jgi:hypothetical protein